MTYKISKLREIINATSANTNSVARIQFIVLSRSSRAVTSFSKGSYFRPCKRKLLISATPTSLNHNRWTIRSPNNPLERSKNQPVNSKYFVN